MTKPLLIIALFLFAYTSEAQTPADSTEVIDTVQMNLICCPINNPLAKCKRVTGYGLLKKSPADITCTNTTGFETIDLQVYMDDKKKVIDRTRYEIYYK